MNQEHSSTFDPYLVLFTHSSDPMVVLDRKGVLIDVNRAAEQFFAINKSVLDGVVDSEQFSFLRTGVCKNALKSSLKNNPSVVSNILIGLEPKRSFDLQFFPTYNADQSVVGTLIVLRDKTLSSTMQQELRRSSHILESITDGFIALDHNLRFLALNSEAERILGVRNEDLIGHTLQDVFPSSMLTSFFARAEEVLKSSQSVEFEEKDFGRDRWYTIRIFPTREGLAVYFHEITDKKTVEEELQKSESLFHTMAHTVPVMIWMSDVNKQCIYLNKEWLTFRGRTLEEELGSGWVEGIHPDDVETSFTQFLAAHSPPAEFEFEYRLRRHDGEYRWVVTKGTPRYDAHGSFIGFIGSTLDITDRKLSALKLAESEERYRAFVQTSSEAIWRFELEKPLRISISVQEQLDHFYQYAYLAECNDSVAQMYGFTHASELIGTRLGDILPKDNTDNINYLKHFITSRYRLSGSESTEFDRYGKVKYFVNSLVGIVEDGYLLRAWGTQQDITQQRLTQELVQNREKEMRLITDSAPALISYVDKNEQFQFVNRTYGDWFGINPKSLIGMSLEEFLGTPSYNLFKKYIKKALSGKKVKFEELIPYATGSRFVSAVYVPDFGPNKVVKGYFALVTDVTEQKRSEEQVRKLLAEMQFQRSRLDSIIQNVPGIVWEAWGRPDKKSQRINFVSDYVEKMLGYTTKEWLNTPNFWLSIVHPEDRQRAGAESAAIYESKRGGVSEFRWITKDGRVLWVEAQSVVVLDEQGNSVGMRGVTMDITYRKEAEETIRYQAFYDSLTSLPNRNLLQDRMTMAIDRAKRNKEKVAVMFLDLDRFKNINDTLGHHTGDQLLQVVAERLRSCLREEDTVARLGGDEFTILLPDIKDSEDALKVARKVFRVLKPIITIGDYEIHTSTSIGIAMYPYDGEDVQTLLKNADIALYRAKEAGRNTFKLFNTSMNKKARAQYSLESMLRIALDKEQFSVYYQPILDMNTNAVVSLEALVRWNHPEMGQLFPSEFIELAEETGLILPLGDWILGRICEDIRKWDKEGAPRVRLAYNLSPSQFNQDTLFQHIEQTLKSNKISARRIDIEITEGVAMKGNFDANMHKLRILKEMGMGITIDDFGTGHSSLSYLKRFPVDTLKIDQSFVKSAITDTKDAIIVETIVGLGHSLDLKVIAEGVETKRQLKFLGDLGCDMAQGFLLSLPLTSDLVAPLLKKSSSKKRAPTTFPVV